MSSVLPTAVAAGTELYLAMFMGAFGALNYAWEGYVDIRLVLLLYWARFWAFTSGLWCQGCERKDYPPSHSDHNLTLRDEPGYCDSMYLRQINVLTMDAGWDVYLNGGSKLCCFSVGLQGVLRFSTM